MTYATAPLPFGGLTEQTSTCEHPTARVPATKECIRAELATHEPALRATAKYLCRHAAETDELVQDTFERALRYLSSDRPSPHHMKPWLVSILRNAFVDRIRRRSPALEAVEDLAIPTVEPAQPWADVTLDDIRAALRRLDANLRRTFELHYLEGLPYREVANRLGVAENTVASRLSRARHALRGELESALRPER